jgi:hypothetical protein
MASKIDWQEATRRILDAIDIRAEYAALGVDITGSEPNASGWLECRASGKEDRTPSAGINIGNEHPLRGRYKEFTGDGRNLSLFEFAAAVGKFPDWQAARKSYAKQVGVKLPSGSQESPGDNLAIRPWIESLAKSWCLQKPPITPGAVQAAGGVLAGWPAKSQQFTVVALPIFGPHGANDDAQGWVIWNKTGRPLPLFQGKGNPTKPTKMLTIGGSKSGWMGRQGLDHIADAEIVWKVEGPGDMMAIMAAIPDELRDKHVVISNSGGTMEVPRDDYVDILAGKRVFVIHDCDTDGQKGGRRWADAIAAVAIECRFIGLPYEITENHGKDVRDYLQDGHTYADLLRLAEGSPVVSRSIDGRQVEPQSAVGADAGGDTKPSDGCPPKKSDPLAQDRAICEALRIDVLGELPDRAVKIFTETYGKNVTIRQIDRITYPDLLQMFGPIVREKVVNSKGGDIPPDMYSLARVKEAIAAVAGAEHAGQGVELGLGVWRGETLPDGHPQIVMVGNGFASVWDGAGLTMHKRPRVAGVKVDIDHSADAAWFDHAKLAEYLAASANQDWVNATFDELCEILEKWYWKSEREITAQIIAGLILATICQSIWSWRPLVSITGASDSGKTTFFELLETLFGRLALLNAKSTEAGLRQTIANHSKAVLCDEFESSKHRKQILEFFRTSSKGSRTLRGTTQQTSREYGLRHICWVTAVEIGLSRAPDRNRFIMLELTPAPKGVRGKLALPPLPHLEDLGQKLLAIAVRHAVAADALASQIKSQQFEGVHGRVVESFSVPVAMLAVCGGFGEEGAVGIMNAIFSAMEPDPSQATKDEVDLLGEILSSTVDIGHGSRAGVAQILLHSADYPGGLDALERAGVARVGVGKGARSDSGYHFERISFN